MKLAPLTFILLFAIVTSCEVTGQYCLKRYHMTQNMAFVATSMMLYATIALMLVWLLKYENIITFNVLWAGVSVLALSTMGFFVLGERLDGYEVIGALFIVTGILFIKTDIFKLKKN